MPVMTLCAHSEGMKTSPVFPLVVKCLCFVTAFSVAKAGNVKPLHLIERQIWLGDFEEVFSN